MFSSMLRLKETASEEKPSLFWETDKPMILFMIETQIFPTPGTEPRNPDQCILSNEKFVGYFGDL